MKPLGLGIIGLHHQHPRWYHPLWDNLPQYKPVAVAEADEAFLKASNDEFFHLNAYTDYHQLLDRKDVDVVIIWTPHSQMPQVVADAAAAGKHVIVEKPCCADLAGGRRIAEAARKHPRLKISAPYCWRAHSVTPHIRQAVQAGLLGEVRAMEGRLNAGGAHRYIRDNCPWMLLNSERGGPLWNLGVHWIDYLRWMTGREIISVCGQVTRVAGGPQREIEDVGQALLTFDNGAVAFVEASYSLPDSFPGKRDVAVSLRGTLGDAVWNPAWEGVVDKLLLVSEAPHVPPADRCRTVEITSKFYPGYCGHMGINFLADFADAIRDDRPPMVTPDDILGAVRVADAFYRSVASGKAEKVEAK